MCVCVCVHVCHNANYVPYAQTPVYRKVSCIVTYTSPLKTNTHCRRLGRQPHSRLQWRFRDKGLFDWHTVLAVALEYNTVTRALAYFQIIKLVGVLMIYQPYSSLHTSAFRSIKIGSYYGIVSLDICVDNTL